MSCCILVFHVEFQVFDLAAILKSICFCCLYELTSVVGLNFDFVVLNLTKQLSYLVFNACLYFSPAVQEQYFEKYGHDEVCTSLSCFSLFNLNSVFLYESTIRDVDDDFVHGILISEAVITGFICDLDLRYSS